MLGFEQLAKKYSRAKNRTVHIFVYCTYKNCLGIVPRSFATKGIAYTLIAISGDENLKLDSGEKARHMIAKHTRIPTPSQLRPEHRGIYARVRH